MKNLIILTSFIFLFLTYSCVDTIFDDYHKTKVEENIPASVMIDYSALSNKIQTRATSDEATEKEVHNLYLLVFNRDGSKVTGQYYSKEQLSGTQLTIDTYSGPEKRIYAVANFAINDMMSLSLADLEKIQTVDELMGLNAHLMQKIVARGSSFLMSGCLEKDGQPASVDILPGNNPNSLGSVKLRKADAKIQFNIEAINGAEFILKEWKVEELPLNVSLYPRPENQFDGKDNFSTEWKKPEGEGSMLGKTFSFYVLEHLRNAKADIMSNDVWESYALREKSPYNWTREGHTLPAGVTSSDDFVFAHDRATYVVFKGHIKYMKGTEPVEGDVTYTVHLGYFDPFNGNIANDYNIRRNTFYTYNVKIASADRVLVEVETGEESHPGADGSLVVGGKTYRFDAHYETTMIEFNKDHIDDNLTWYVKTPFDDGEASEMRKDFDWILFCLNPKGNDGYQTDYVAFPGLSKLYDGPLDAVSYLNAANRLIDVKQLVGILKSASKSDLNFYDTNGNVRFTAFIQEYYYDKTPGTNIPFESALWKKFVNAPERVMNILSENKYSPDGNSMRTKVFYSFRQASIQTMYNTDPALTELVTAWGTEMIQDNTQMNFYPNGDMQAVNDNWSSPYSSKNGRQNTIELWRGDIFKSWSAYVNSANAAMNDAYKIAKYACMQRNRDLNGNNIIDKDEVRWYLAALDQLTDLWIGEQSFDREAYLYKKEMEIPGSDFERQWGEMWYVSSTINKIKIRTGGIIVPKYTYYADPTVLWSSEGASVGQLEGVPNAGYKKLYYRCLRNLGIEASNETDVPAPIGVYSSGTGVISMNSLDPNSIRDYSQDTELPEHHERESHNLPFRSFEVSKTISGSGLSWTAVRDKIRNNDSPCKSLGSGWRVPNQRELALMRSIIGNDGRWTAENHMSRTRFSMNPVGDSRHGFSVTNSAGILFLINNLTWELGGVRCVKDKTN